MTDKFYIIEEIKPDGKTGACITDGCFLSEVKQRATQYYQELAYDCGEYGCGEKEVMLTEFNGLDDEEGTEYVMTLSWGANDSVDMNQMFGTNYNQISGVK